MTVAVKGTVYLVGAGPGDPELLTLKAADLLATADVVLHDDLVPAPVLERVNPRALLLNVGKRCGKKRITQAAIHSLMIDAALRDQSVVRLKSGDPLVFGRAGEEMEALEQAGIPYQVVPGITAMFAAAAALRTPLTDRRASSKIILTTAHHAENQSCPSIWNEKLPEDATLGIYMPGRDLSQLARELLASGLPSTLPCTIVSRAAQPDQSVQHATLGRLSDFEPGPAPVLVLAGALLGTRELQPSLTTSFLSAELVREQPESALHT